MGILTGYGPLRAEAGGDALRRAMEDTDGRRTRSGVRVSEDNAMRVSTVYACVRVVSEDMAKLPLILYRRKKGGGKERATDHPMYQLLHDRPNGFHTSFEFREFAQQAVELRGNGFAFKSRVNGRIVELLPLHPASVAVSRRKDWEPVYRWNGDDYTREDILHFRGLGDGLVGWSPIRLHRETVGLTAATMQHGARLFGNMAQPSGVLESPLELSDAAAARVLQSWEDTYGGENNGRVAMLEGGLKFSPITMNSDDAQYLETRAFQRTEIASIWRVPPHMVGALEHATFTNIEQQSTEYVTNSLLARLIRVEQRLNADLLTPAERGVYFFEHLVDGISRGDQAARFAAYQSAINTGWMSPNEARERENLDPQPGLEEYRRPLNTEPAQAAGRS